MSSPARVLVVEDEPLTADIVCRYLDRAGYDTMAERDGNVALARVAEWQPDLIVLDIMLPGLGGLDVLRHLRDKTAQRVAVILLSAKRAEVERVEGLSLGADDYVVKPFSAPELAARVAALLRRTRADQEQAPLPLVFDGLEIDLASRRVLVDDNEVSLTQREHDLLVFLAGHAGQTFTREELMDNVWRFAFYSETTTVTVHIRRLRAKIEREPARPRYIETVWGVGYRFRP